MIVDMIAEEAKDLFQTVHYDAGVPAGSSFTDFMDNIESAQVVALCCTPLYRQKAQDLEAGVGYEYSRILNKFQRFKEAQRSENIDESSTLSYQRFTVIPLLLSGAPDNAIPEDLLQSRVRYVDLRFFRPHSDRKTGSIVLASGVRRDFESKLTSAFRPFTNVLSLGNSKGYNENVEMLLTRLFAQRKALGPHVVSNERLPSEAFVKTHAYERVRSQKVIFLIGRKGRTVSRA